MDSKRDKIRRIFTILLLFKYIRSVMTTNIDCRGKPFHCANSTHFMICVDLGFGITKTVNDFMIKCPPTTSCQESNQFECEYQLLTTTSLPFFLVDKTNGLKMDVTTQLEHVHTNSNLQKTSVTRLFNKMDNTIDMKTNAGYIPQMPTLRHIEISNTPARLTTNIDNQESIKNTSYKYLTTKYEPNTVEDYPDFTLSYHDSQATTEKTFKTDITDIITNKTKNSNTINLYDEGNLKKSMVSFLHSTTPGTMSEVASTWTTQDIVQADFLINTGKSILNGISSKFKDSAKLTSKFDLNEETGTEFSTTPAYDIFIQTITKNVIDTNQTKTKLSNETQEEHYHNVKLPETLTNLEVRSTTLIDNNYSYYTTTSKEYHTTSPETGLLEYTTRKTGTTIPLIEEYDTKLTLTEGINTNDILTTKHLPFIREPTRIFLKNGAFNKKGKSGTYMHSSNEFDKFENSTVTSDLKVAKQRIQSKTAPTISSYELGTSRVTIPVENLTKNTNVHSDYGFTTESSLSTLESRNSGREAMTDTNKTIENTTTETSSNLEVTPTTLTDNYYSYYMTTTKEYQTTTPETGTLANTITQKREETISPIEEYETKFTFTKGININDNLTTHDLPFILKPTTTYEKNVAYNKKGKSGNYMPSTYEFYNQFESSTMTSNLKAEANKIQSNTAPTISSYEQSTSTVTMPVENFTTNTNFHSDYVFRTESSISTLELRLSATEPITDTNKTIKSIITTNNDIFLVPFENPQDSFPEVENTTKSLVTLGYNISDSKKASTAERNFPSRFEDDYITYEDTSVVNLTPQVDYTTQSMPSVVTNSYFETTSPNIGRALRSTLMGKKVRTSSNKMNSTTDTHRNFTFPGGISMNNVNTSSNFKFTIISPLNTLQLPITYLENVTDTYEILERNKTSDLNTLLLFPHETSQIPLTDVQATSTSPNFEFDIFSNKKKEAVTEVNFGNHVTIFNNDNLIHQIAPKVELQDKNILKATPSVQTKNLFSNTVTSIDQKLNSNQNITLLQHGHYYNMSEVISLGEGSTENANTYNSLIQTESLMLSNDSTIPSFSTIGAVVTTMDTNVFIKEEKVSAIRADDLLPHKATISMATEEDVTKKYSTIETISTINTVNYIDKSEIMNRFTTNLNEENQEYVKDEMSITTAGRDDFLIGAENISLNVYTNKNTRVKYAYNPVHTSLNASSKMGVKQNGLTKKANVPQQNLYRDLILVWRDSIFTSTEKPSFIKNNTAKGNLPIVDLAYNYFNPHLIAENNTKLSINTNESNTILTEMQHKISQEFLSASHDNTTTENTLYTEQLITAPQTDFYSYVTEVTTESMVATHSLLTTKLEPLIDEEAATENTETLNVTTERLPQDLVSTETSFWQRIYPAGKELLVTSESNIRPPQLTSLQTNFESKGLEILLPMNTTSKEETKNKYDNLMNTTNKNTFTSTFSNHNITVRSYEKDMVSKFIQNRSRLYLSTTSGYEITRNKVNDSDNASIWDYENNKDVLSDIIKNTGERLERTTKVISENAITNITGYSRIRPNTNNTIPKETITSYNSNRSNIQAINDFLLKNESIKVKNKYVHNVNVLETGKMIDDMKNTYLPSTTYMAFMQESNKSSISKTVTTITMLSNNSIKLQPFENSNVSESIVPNNIYTSYNKSYNKLNATTEERISNTNLKSGNIQPGQVSIKRSLLENSQSLNENNKEITTKVWKTAYETTTQIMDSNLGNSRNQSILHSRIDIRELEATNLENIKPLQSVDFSLIKTKNSTSTVDIPKTTNRATMPDDTKVNKNPEDVDLFSCWNRFRGRYPDIKDCRKFYICIGKVQPVHGECPAGTVFSKIKKQCTKNLAHCIRNNQFHCIQEGRFSDLLKNNIYYICVNIKNKFIRFQFQCSRGYHLNKANVRCVHDMKTPSLSTSISNDNDSNKGSEQSTVEKSKEKKQVTTIDTNICKVEGKFPDADDCRRYYVCSKNSKSEFRRKIKKCDSDEVFHREKKKCVDGDSYECK